MRTSSPGCLPPDLDLDLLVTARGARRHRPTRGPPLPGPHLQVGHPLPTARPAGLAHRIRATPRVGADLPQLLALRLGEEALRGRERERIPLTPLRHLRLEALHPRPEGVRGERTRLTLRRHRSALRLHPLQHRLPLGEEPALDGVELGHLPRGEFELPTEVEEARDPRLTDGAAEPTRSALGLHHEALPELWGRGGRQTRRRRDGRLRTLSDGDGGEASEREDDETVTEHHLLRVKGRGGSAVLREKTLRCVGC